MKLLLDVKDDKAPFMLELLKHFKFVKVKQLTKADARFLTELKEAVDELNLMTAGKLKGRPVEELLKEL